MRTPRLLLAALLGAGLFAAPAITQKAFAEDSAPMKQNWSFNGIFGTPDIPSAQRGLQVYAEVCSTCHSMKLLHYRDLEGLGLNPEQIKAFAAGFTVPQGLDNSGQPKEGPATPANQFRSPFPNDLAARAANNSALPPDLSLIINAREDGANYVYGLMTGYADPPKGFTMQDGMNYNQGFPGHQIAMPRPLQDGRVTFTDGSPNSTDQEARDVVTFLAWASNPEAAERKAMGVRVVLFLILLTGVTYMVKRKVWASLH